MSTKFLTKSEIQKKWLVIDAKHVVVGRLATEVAKILRGKNKPEFTPFLDCGDNVVVINARKVSFSGNKMDRKDGKIYYRHTGHPGGIKETTAGRILEGKYPERVVEMAVKRMLKRNNLSRDQMKNLYIYPDEAHPHSGQKPEVYDFAAKSRKNTKVPTRQKA